LISANAVQSAPVGLAAAISAAALLAGTTITTSTAIAITKTIAMTTLQKTLITITIATFAGAGIYEARQAAHLREQNQALQQQQAPLVEQNRQLQQQHDDATNQLAGLLAENARLKSNVNEGELLKLRGQVAALHSAAAKRGQPASPRMKDAMKTIMAAGIDRMYAKLFADLNLTPEQAATLKDLLVKKSVAGMDASADMLSAATDPAGQAKLAEQIKAEKDAVDDQIKDVIGPAAFAQYQAYQTTYTDRGLISGPDGLADQLAGAAELTDGQTEQLIQAMTQNRQNFKFTTDYSENAKLMPGYVSSFTDSNIAQHQQEAGQLYQLDLTSAQGILSPDQLTAFQKFLANRQQIETTMLQMSAKMYGANDGN
jgi:hypothetical protein